MVFEHLTMFEFHLENAQFGPRTMSGHDEAGDEPAEAEMAAVGSGGSSRLVPVLVLAALAAGVALLWRRSRADTPEVDIAFADEAEAAAPQ